MRNHISEAQLAANRANAQKSTGPTSEAGKAASSQNRRSYGLTGAFILLPEENKSEYLAMFEALTGEYQPATPTEQLLVKKMAQHQWMADRALDHQAHCFSKENFLAFEKQVSLFMRYHTLHDRAFHKALTELRKAQKERKENELHLPELKAQTLEANVVHQMSKVRLNNAKAKALQQNGFVSQNPIASPETLPKEHPAAA